VNRYHIVIALVMMVMPLRIIQAGQEACNTTSAVALHPTERLRCTAGYAQVSSEERLFPLMTFYDLAGAPELVDCPPQYPAIPRHKLDPQLNRTFDAVDQAGYTVSWLTPKNLKAEKVSLSEVVLLHNDVLPSWRDIEEKVAGLAFRYKGAAVLSGAVYLGSKIQVPLVFDEDDSIIKRITTRHDSIEFPQAVYKIVYLPYVGRGFAIYFDNSAGVERERNRLDLMTIEQVEGLTGRSFFPYLQPIVAARVKGSQFLERIEWVYELAEY
jgi:hypothetical protein